jgi:hypothetical protein
MIPTTKIVNKTNDVGLKVGIVIMGFLILIGIILIVVFEKQYSDCRNNESPLCLSGNCPASSGTDADGNSCSNQPFLVVNGQIECKPPITFGQAPTVSFQPNT